MAGQRLRYWLLPLFVVMLLIPLGCGNPKEQPPVPAESSGAAGFPATAESPSAARSSGGAGSRGVASSAARPLLPEQAKQNNREGFAAFTQYWFDTVTYALESGDVVPLREASAPSCAICTGYVEAALGTHDKGWTSEGPRWSIVAFTSDVPWERPGPVLGFFVVEESPSRRLDASGAVAEVHNGGRSDRAKAIYALYEHGQWKTVQAGHA